MDSFYVYQHKTTDTGEIFYIGKDKGYRAFSKIRNKYWHKIVNKHGFIVEIVRDNLSEQEAFDVEKELIKSITPRANICLGGGGVTGYKHGPEQLKKMSEYLNSDIFKQKMQQARIKKHWNSFPRKPIICTTTGIQYPSVTHAAKELNLATSWICRVLKGKLAHARGLKFDYVGGPSCQ